MAFILKRIAVVASAVFLLAALGATAASAAPAPAASPGGTLYVQQARGGTLVKKGDSWRLVLHEPAKRTTSFADRPLRVGGSLSLAKFVSSWRSNFGDDAPNAALEINGAPQSRDVALLELSAPRYDAARGLLTFDAKPLTTSADPALGTLVRRADRGVHGGFGRASLFIDSGDEGDVLNLTFKEIPAISYIEIGLITAGDEFTFDPPATYTSATEGIGWRTQDQGMFVDCYFAGCSGTATVSVKAPPTQPLTLQFDLPTTGTVTAQWAGGPVTTIPQGGDRVSLQPAQP